MPMTKEEIIRAIQEHIDSISVGDFFATESALYQALQLDPAEDHKKLKRYVSQYMTWEKTNQSNSRGGRSNQIEIMEIVDDASDFVPTDRRQNNGGVRVQYGDKVADAIAARINNGGNFSYKQFFRRFYDIDLGIIENQPSVTFLTKYYQNVKNFLSSATNRALNSLASEGMLTWERCFFLEHRPSHFFPDAMIDFFTPDTTIADFVLYYLELLETDDVAQEPVYQEIRDYINSIEIGKTGERLSFEKTKFLDYLKDSRISNAQKDTQLEWLLQKFTAYLDGNDLDGNIEDEDEQKSDSLPATDQEQELIQKITDAAIHSLGYTAENYQRDIRLRQNVYQLTGMIYQLFGWGRVWYGLSVAMIDPEAHQADKNQPDIRAVLEKPIARSIANKHRNDKEVAAKRHTFGKSPDAFRNTMPEGNIYYLADSEEINRLHCKLFSLAEDPAYLKSFISDHTAQEV